MSADVVRLPARRELDLARQQKELQQLERLKEQLADLAKRVSALERER